MRALTNQSGAVVATYTYDAYGQPTASTGSVANPFGYAGEYQDAESGFIYLRARYYDPATQQFLTVDPLLAATEQAYAYAAGSPLNATDPMGLSTIPTEPNQSILYPSLMCQWLGWCVSNAERAGKACLGSRACSGQFLLTGVVQLPLEPWDMAASVPVSAGRAARGNAGQQALETMFPNGLAGVRFPASNGQCRIPDLVERVDGRTIAHEAKNFSKPVGNGGHSFTEALQDFKLMQSDPNYVPIWHFLDKGPTAGFSDTLDFFGISYVVYHP